MRYVLSLDGGGIRGIIPALVLTEIERATGKRVAEQFDLIAGTSTGGILALGLLKDSGLKQAQYSPLELSKIYQDKGKTIFDRSFWRGVSSVGGLMDEKYSSAGLRSVLDDYFDNTLFSSVLKKALITSYDIEKREPVFFKSWREEFADLKMTDIALATSAAPTYFEPARFRVGSEIATLIDGGVFVNNPAVSAYVEALRLFPGEEIKVVSIGTGELTRPIPYEESKDWGKAGWVVPVLDCMFDGVSDATDYQMKQLLGDNYIRFQTRLTLASDDMDNASAGNINLLAQEAEKLLKEKEAEIASMF